MDKIKKMTEIEKMEYEHYVNHRNYLRSEKHKMENKYSQHLIYLSAGIFAFMSNIDKFMLNKNEILIYDFLLLQALCLSLISLISILISFLFSIRSFKTEIDYWDKEGKNHPSNCNTKIMHYFTNLGTFSLILSISFLFIFYTYNF